MVNAKISTIRQGARTDLVPIGTKLPDAPITLEEAAKMMNVSVRTVKRVPRTQSWSLRLRKFAQRRRTMPPCLSRPSPQQVPVTVTNGYARPAMC
jgi:hypothetical protein